MIEAWLASRLRALGPIAAAVVTVAGVVLIIGSVIGGLWWLRADAARDARAIEQHQCTQDRLLANNEAIEEQARIDRETAGLVLFSTNPDSRTRYQALFRERRIEKRYQATAPALPQLVFPCTRISRIVAGEPFFRMQEADGMANSETRIDVIARGDDRWRYALTPVTGRKHQLRVHMAALGAPIDGDPLYPSVRHRAAGDYVAPLQLLAEQVAFIDPISGVERRFSSAFRLQD